jgi:hypothetical protein
MTKAIDHESNQRIDPREIDLVNFEREQTE